MKKYYILDACSLIAFLADESGAEKVEQILEQSKSQKYHVEMSKINLLEVYYGIYREEGDKKAAEVLAQIKLLPIRFIEEISDRVFKEAGRLKAEHKISLADSIAVAEAITSNSILVTADHHEIEALEKNGEVIVDWIR